MRRELVLIVVVALILSVASADDFVVRRNVKDYGAYGDGIHDDTAAFIAALTTDKATKYVPNTPWNYSQYNCQTTKPSIVLVPDGVYLITATLPLTYYTQLVGGNVTHRPTLLFESTAAIHALDAGIDEGPGNGWYGNVNQNNFYHQVRNLIVNITQCTGCVAIHWQVSQATNIVNCHFEIGAGGTGLLMEDGSGGYFGDSTFNGGSVALAIGNQQFTVRNVTITNSEVGVLLNWGWIWAFHNLTIRNVLTAVRMNNGVSSVSFVDLVVSQARQGVVMSNENGGTQMTLDNCDFTDGVAVPLLVNASIAILDPSVAANYIQARQTDGTMFSGPVSLLPRPEGLVTTTGTYFGMMRPSYQSIVTANLTNGTDVTAALQSLLNAYQNTGTAVLIPYGVYFLSSTLVVPVGSRLFGEVWTRFAPIGATFQDAAHPKPMMQVGQPGDVGVAQLADFMFTNVGSAPGAILLEWHVEGAQQGDSGIWDSHFRIGGAVGTELNPTNCPTNATLADFPHCQGVHTLFRIAPNASVYVENMWGWVADHDLDLGPDVNVYNPRGLLVETNKPVWLFGTAMEHSYLYQYRLQNRSANILLSILQTETPYMQPEFLLVGTSPSDPPFSEGQTHAYSIAANEVQNVVLYGTGMYSFFHRWNQSCGGQGQTYCQDHVSLWTTFTENAQVDAVRLHNFNTHASEYVTFFNGEQVLASETANGFCDTISVFPH